MTSEAEVTPSHDSTAWELPSFDVAVHFPRTHSYALVIPVINEGERIRNQLLRIRNAKLPVDVIVADGGSTDGSLHPSFTAGAGVRAVLTKTGPGKLSAQLRMAYAWCLREGYEGIVTIDGNGKDGVEAVADMVSKLREGFDYVQGSRYLPGGVAENTPLERSIANRVIHAPLLSLAGRHWFTDTTNGFRAYSARYLLDPQVQPFRDVFQRYELLFYLTVRAGQIGMKVGQVPVARRYPSDGKVPTKIEGITSKLKVLGETLSAATGGYTPDASKPTYPPWLWLIVLTLLIALPLFLGSVVSPDYSPDSWAYYELGRTIFGDFYRFSHFRTYWSSSPYSSSFPPLFPAAIAMVDSLFATGARSGFYLAFLSFFIFALASEQIGRRVFGVAWLGLATALGLLLGPVMLLAEMTAGRTIPLQLVFYAIAFLYLLNFERMNLAGAIGLGLVCGLAVLNRFDAVFLPLLVAAALWFLTRRLASALVVLFCASIVVSPWIVYSLSHFGIAFATDNSRVATAIDPLVSVTDWWPVAQPTLVDNPIAWLKRIFENIIEFTQALASVTATRMGLVFFLSWALLAGVQFITRYDGKHFRIDTCSSKKFSVIRIFAAITLLLLLPQVLTGYFDERYFIPLFWSGFLLVAGCLVQRGRNDHQRQVFARIIFFAIAIAVIVFSGLVLMMSSHEGRLDWNKWSEFENPDDVSSLNECIGSDKAARILVLGTNRFAARAGALSGLHTMMEPRNMSIGRLGAEGSRAFLAAWKVGYVLIASPKKMDFAASTFTLEKVPHCSLTLYRVVR